MTVVDIDMRNGTSDEGNESNEGADLPKLPTRIIEALTTPASQALTQAAKIEYALAMGQEEGDISFLSVDWGALMQRGGKGSVTFGYWRATKSLDYEDIGLTGLTTEERTALDAVVQLPKGRLLVGFPVPEFQSVENKGRATLKAFSIPTELGPFVPLGEVDERHPKAGWHYDAFLNAMKEVEQQFLAVRDKMGDQWEVLISQTIAYWSQLADKLYADMLTANRLPTKRALKIAESDDTPDQAEWVNWFLNTKVRPFVRTKQEAMAAVRFKLSMQPILPPQALLQAQAEAALDDAELRLRQDFVASAGNAVDSFFRDVVAELRARLFDTCADALAAMDNNGGKIPTRNQTAIRALIEYVETVKVWPDRDIEDQLDEMRMMLDMPAQAREIAQEDLRQMFRKIAAEARLTCQEIDRMDERTSRQIKGVPDEGPELEKLAGRQRREIAMLDDDVDDGVSFTGRRGRAIDLQN